MSFYQRYQGKHKKITAAFHVLPLTTLPFYNLDWSKLFYDLNIFVWSIGTNANILNFSSCYFREPVLIS